MSKYYELLKHPQWQQKRLRIMERDGFTCCECGDDDTTLNVHHRYYIKNNAPWDYPDEALLTLCENCHARRHELNQLISQVIGGLSYRQAAAALGYAAGFAAFDARMSIDFDWGAICDMAAFAGGIADHLLTVDPDKPGDINNPVDRSFVDLGLSRFNINLHGEVA